jgi:LAO/AO transport system kinase
VTGPPGAGKSSLVGELIGLLLERSPRIGVLTVDPSSPVSGGAVLGDRVRMAAHSRNPAVFIRSLAARGHLGGVTRSTRAVLDLLGAAGFDLVVVETVGAGQSEVEVARITDVRLVVCPPGLGDDMQAIKAGVLEIADLLVVNKADLPDAARTAGHLTAMLHHRGHDETRQVLRTSATTGEGLRALAGAIEGRFAQGADGARPSLVADFAGRDALADAAAELIRGLILADARLDELCRAVARGDVSHHDGALAALRMVAEHHDAGGGLPADTRSLVHDR